MVASALTLTLEGVVPVEGLILIQEAEALALNETGVLLLLVTPIVWAVETLPAAAEKVREDGLGDRVTGGVVTLTEIETDAVGQLALPVQENVMVPL